MTASPASGESPGLRGRRIVVTRAAAVGDTLAERLRSLGSIIVEAPVTTIEPSDPRPIDEAVARLARYDWLILTSRTGVRMFWEALSRAGLDARSLHRIRIAAIGTATDAALRERGVTASVIPERFVAEALLEALKREPSVPGSKILYATAEGARDILPTGLREIGATVDVVVMYRSVPNRAAAGPLIAAIDANQVDLVTFASGSAVESFVSLVGVDRAGRIRAASIGPITTAAARQHGIEIIAEARESTIDGLVQAVAGIDWRAHRG